MSRLRPSRDLPRRARKVFRRLAKAVPDARSEHRFIIESAALLLIRAPKSREPGVIVELAAHLAELNLVPAAEAP